MLINGMPKWKRHNTLKDKQYYGGIVQVKQTNQADIVSVTSYKTKGSQNPCYLDQVTKGGGD